MCNPTIKNAIFGGLIKTAIAKNNPRDGGGGGGISPLISPVASAIVGRRKAPTPTAAMPIMSSMNSATTPLGS